MSENPGSEWKPRRPDFKLKVKIKKGKTHRDVGVAWANEAGHISIQLLPATVLDWRDDLVITLFPTDS